VTSAFLDAYQYFNFFGYTTHDNNFWIPKSEPMFFNNIPFRYLPVHLFNSNTQDGVLYNLHIKNILDIQISPVSPVCPEVPTPHNSRLEKSLTFFGLGGGWKCLKVSSLASASCLTEVVSSGLLHRSRNRSNRFSRSSGPEDKKGCGYTRLLFPDTGAQLSAPGIV
jgi:hypothetical protein